MAFALFFDSECANSGEDLLHKISKYKIQFKNSPSEDIQTLDHSDGLIGYDFPMEKINALLRDHPLAEQVKGLRIVPAVDNQGIPTVVIAPYDTDGNELFVNEQLVGECCPQPPNTHAGTTLDGLVQAASV